LFKGNTYVARTGFEPVTQGYENWNTTLLLCKVLIIKRYFFSLNCFMSYFVLFLTLFLTLHFIDMGTLTRYKSYPYLIENFADSLILICNRYFKVIDIVHFVIDHKFLCFWAFFRFIIFKAPKEGLQLRQYSPFLVNSNQSFVLKDKRNFFSLSVIWELIW
jgi:hypothetical protein